MIAVLSRYQTLGRVIVLDYYFDMDHTLTTSLDIETIPQIDLAPYLAGEPGAAEAAAERLRWVQEEIGFYYLINHSLPAEVVERAYEQVEAFYALPLEEKLKLKVDHLSTGYVPIKSTVYVTSEVNENTKKDLNENYRIVRERPADHPGILAGRRFTGPNKWPDPALLPDFKPAMLAYYQAMEDLGYSLLPLYAMALGLAPDYFNDMFTDPNWMTRNVHYPAVEAEENQFGISPHTDHGFITLLPINEIPGLEVKSQAGTWIPAEYIPGALIVNSGDFMTKWTNGRFIATPHRVLTPKTERYISAFFYSPNWDVMSNPLPGCAGPDNPPAYEVTSFLEHQCNYVDRNYAKSSGGTQADDKFS